MDGVFMISGEGTALVVWMKTGAEGGSRIQKWLADWRLETCAAAEP
jgi:hypothetical protein